MSEQRPAAETTPVRRPAWHVPVVTALVIVAVLLVLYPSAPPV